MVDHDLLWLTIKLNDRDDTPSHRFSKICTITSTFSDLALELMPLPSLMFMMLLMMMMFTVLMVMMKDDDDDDDDVDGDDDDEDDEDE